MKLSVVVPVHNEQDNIRPLINEIRHCLDGRVTYELIYVDDGSEDNTLAELQAIQCEGCSSLTIIVHQGCFGQSAAIQSGAQVARGEWLATLDGDGQNDPTDILVMLNAVQNDANQNLDYCCVAGHRKKRNDSWVKLFSSRLANNVRRGLLNDGTPDTGCGIKLMKRLAYLQLPFFDHQHRFIPALILRNGGRVLVQQVNHRPRTAGRSKYGIGNRLWVGLVDLFGVKWLCARAKVPVFKVIPSEVNQDVG